jgi:hypothetical protein
MKIENMTSELHMDMNLPSLPSAELGKSSDGKKICLTQNTISGFLMIADYH